MTYPNLDLTHNKREGQHKNWTPTEDSKLISSNLTVSLSLKINRFACSSWVISSSKKKHVFFSTSTRTLYYQYKYFWSHRPGKTPLSPGAIHLDAEPVPARLKSRTRRLDADSEEPESRSLIARLTRFVVFLKKLY